MYKVSLLVIVQDVHSKGQEKCASHTNMNRHNISSYEYKYGT